MDFILNGQGTGDVASVLMQNQFDPGALRPWRGYDGKSYVTLVKRDAGGFPILHNSKTIDQLAKKRGLQLNEEQRVRMIGQPMTHNVQTNATATLRKDDWILLDRAVVEAAKDRLQAFADLRAMGGSITIPNGMGKTVLEYEAMSDISGATVSMDGIREGESDRPQFDLRGLPLPITHKDFQFSARQVMASRQGGTPIDTATAALASRRVSEEIERQTVGTSSHTYAGNTIYGYKNFPQRLTKSLTDPTGSWDPATLVAEVLDMKALSQAANHYGPWRCYCSPDWDPYMDDDYSANKGDLTLRERIGRIAGISEPVTLDYLQDFDLILVQSTPDVARAVVGMDVTTVQWPSMGGMQLNFKVMAILVPNLRADYNDNTGIVHGSV